jgi:hypothetical protein
MHRDATVILRLLWRSPMVMTTDGVDIVTESVCRRSLVVFEASQCWAWPLVDGVFPRLEQ